MSKEGVVSFVEKALSDAAFQSQLKADPDKAMGQFDLTDDERTAIRSGSEEELKALGLDRRLSKTAFFGLGGEGGGDADGGDGGDGADADADADADA